MSSAGETTDTLDLLTLWLKPLRSPRFKALNGTVTVMDRQVTLAANSTICSFRHWISQKNVRLRISTYFCTWWISHLNSDFVIITITYLFLMECDFYWIVTFKCVIVFLIIIVIKTKPDEQQYLQRTRYFSNFREWN